MYDMTWYDCYIRFFHIHKRKSNSDFASSLGRCMFSFVWFGVDHVGVTRWLTCFLILRCCGGQSNHMDTSWTRPCVPFWTRLLCCFFDLVRSKTHILLDITCMYLLLIRLIAKHVCFPLEYVGSWLSQRVHVFAYPETASILKQSQRESLFTSGPS